MAVVAIASATFPASCARKTPRAERAKDATAVISPAAAVRGPSGAIETAAPKPLAQIPLSASIRGFGLGVLSVPRVASDFSLGPLQSDRPAEGDEAGAFAIAKAFMKGLAEGKIDKELLLPNSRDALSALLMPSAPGSTDRPAIPYRLGAILLRGPDASLRIRLPAAAGESRVEGLLSLRKAGDTWYVEALALDPPVDGPLAFNPAANAGAQRR